MAAQLASRSHDESNLAVARERGFVMVALLVGMAVAAIWMTAALPSWRQQVQRQREADLIFRGEQYARAIVLFQDKNQGNLPPSIEVLVSQHHLRKKWKDPVTNDDFVLVGAGAPIGQAGQQQPGAGQNAGRGGQPTGGGPQVGGVQVVGISGVRSKSAAASIKIYQNQQQYNLWQFDAALIRGRMGRPQGGNQPQGGRGNQPGGRQGAAGDRGGQAPGVGGAPGRGGDQPVRPGQPPGGRGGGAPLPPIGRGRGGGG